MIHYPFLVGSLVAALVIYKAANLARYVAQARATGLPYVITPVLETEFFGLLITPLLRYLYHGYLDQGKGWPRWCRFIIKDWQWEDKRRAHDEYGDVFLCVSPEGIICYCADADVNWDVMNRRNDFTKPADKYKLLELYGPNVATAEGATYRFHVRMTAPPFGDLSGVNDLVWDETIHQTRRLSEAWSRQSQRELHMDVNSLTLAVISLAGFGKRVEWVNSTEDEEVPKGYRVSFLRAIDTTTTNMVPILLFPRWLMSLIPALKPVRLAHEQLENYICELIRSEKSKLEGGDDLSSQTTRSNLLTSVVRVSRMEAQLDQKVSGRSRKDMFTERETMGNLFIYLLAGYETTANAIVYGLVLLALHQDIQSQVIEEIHAAAAAAAAAGREELSYREDFEKLPYTFAFMYESFRLYPGVTLITKMTTNGDKIMVSNDGRSSAPTTYHLPPETRVYLSAPGTHYNSRYWPDPEKVDPSRWLSDDSSGGIKMNSVKEGAEKRVVGADKTRQMRGRLLTFSDGSRACLGRKFAQAEFMAFIATLLKDYRVVLADGEDAKRAYDDLFLKSAGKVTMSPCRQFGLTLRKHEKVQ